MNNPFVADASIGIAWTHSGQADEGTDRLALDVLEGRTFVVPQLWMLEVANGILALQRRKKLDRVKRVWAGQNLVALNPIVDDEATRIAFSRISELADDTGLTVYDATYLELALRRNLPLASRDAALNKAAKRCGVKTLL